MFKAIEYLFAAAIVLSFLFYPFLKSARNRKKLFKWFIVVYLLVMLLSSLITYTTWFRG